MALVVQKYGGTSVATVERIRKVAERIIRSKQTGMSMVVVLSAMGKTTDVLIQMAKDLARHPDEREMDMLVSTGEQVSAALLAIALRQKGCEAISLTGWQAGILTEANHMDARIRSIDPSLVQKHLNEGKVVVVTGYQGVSEEGDITTLGRGGSDTSAVALAASLEAEQCEIYTDVAGVYTADPRMVPAAQKRNSISYADMLALSRMGAGVLHSRCVEAAMRNQVPLVVRSSFTYEEGTRVGGEAEPLFSSAFCGVALQEESEQGMAKVSIVGADRETANELMRKLSRLAFPVRWMPHQDTTLSCLVPRSFAKAAMQAIHSLLGLDAKRKTAAGFQ